MQEQQRGHFIEWLAPTPNCWKCDLEERNYYSPKKDPKDNRLDHQVIICVGYSSDGSTKEIIFDWWGDVKHNDNQSGVLPTNSGKSIVTQHATRSFLITSAVMDNQ